MRVLIPVLCLILLSCDNSNEGRRSQDSFAADSAWKANKAVAIKDADSLKSAQHATFDTTEYSGNAIYARYIPKRIRDYLATKLPEWKLLTLDHWEGYWIKKYRTDSSLVNYFTADINCDGKADHALLLLDTTMDQLGIWVISDLGNEIAAELVGTLDKASPMQYGISVRRQNTIYDMYEDKPIHPSCACIDFVKFESASRTYYYSKGEYRYVQTSD